MHRAMCGVGSVMLAVILCSPLLATAVLRPKPLLTYYGFASSINQTFSVAGAAAASAASAPFRVRPQVEPGAVFTSAVNSAAPLFTRSTDRGQVFVHTSAHIAGFERTMATLFPQTLQTSQGAQSAEPLAVLSVHDQTGSAVAAGTSITFSPAATGYTGVLTFVLPADIPVETMTGLAVHTNYHGPHRTVQRWLWSLWDFRQRQWIRLGDNSGADTNVWTPLQFPVSGEGRRFVSPTGRLRIRYQTSSAVDESTLDYLAVVVPHPGGIWRPPPGTSWQWQLQGTIDTSVDVQMYDIDLFDTPQRVIDQLHAAGRIVICYFSAGSWEQFRSDASQFPRAVRGRTLDGFADERWLDIRRLDILAPLMRARLDLAVQKQCDGVEPDNVDGYDNRTGFPLRAADQLTYNRWLATAAHARGLSVGLKNDVGQIADLVAYFDWALNEQCFQFNECALLKPFVQAGKAVFGVEYRGDPQRFCPQANRLGFSWLKKRLGLGSWRIDCQTIGQ